MKLNVFTSVDTPDLDRLKANLTLNKSPILEAIGVYMEAETITNFEDQGRPRDWEKMAASTVKQKRGNMILHDSGILKAGIMSWVENDSAVIGPSGPAIPYARIHQKGGKTGRNYATVITARPYLIVLEENLLFIRDFIRGEVLNA